MYVVSAMVGNKLGENKGAEAKKVVHFAFIIMTAISIFIDILLIIF